MRFNTQHRVPPMRKEVIIAHSSYHECSDNTGEVCLNKRMGSHASSTNLGRFDDGSEYIEPREAHEQNCDTQRAFLIIFFILKEVIQFSESNVNNKINVIYCIA